VPQEESFKFEFRVRDVVAMGRMPLSNSLWDSEADTLSAENAMKQADCFHLQDRSVMELSGGEKQRVLIARALAQGSPLVLIDEPTSHLDVEHQLGVAHLVSHLAQEGKATITAIHDLNLASHLADRAVLLQDGKIGLDGPIRTVLESPLLDDVYRVRFERIRLDNDRLIVVPSQRS
jgi:iron complex transport system ATP-binding protein